MRVHNGELAHIVPSWMRKSFRSPVVQSRKEHKETTIAHELLLVFFLSLWFYFIFYPLLSFTLFN